MSEATEQGAALVIAPQWVGDAILSLPLIDQLAGAHDGVDVLATPSVSAVYRCSPSVRNIIEAPFAHGQLQWGLRQQIAQSLRGRYALAVVLPNSLKSALIPWMAGIAIRRGMTGESRFLLLNDRRSPPVTSLGKDSARSIQRPSMLHHYLSLADRPLPIESIDGLGAHRPRMRLPIGLARGQMPAGPLLAVCPGAEYGPAKQWPAQKFAETAIAWIAQSPTHQAVVVGSPKDRELGEVILGQVQAALSRTAGIPSDRIRNLCGQTSLIDAFAWISAASLVISNDSGLMHAAAAFDIPVIALFGSTDPQHTPPHSDRAHVISLRLACSPCFARTCPLGTTACLKDIPAQDVIRLFPRQGPRA